MATAAVQRSSCTRRAASRVRHWSREVPPTVFPRLASTTGSDTWTSMQRFCGSCCSRAYKVVPKHEEGGALSTPTAPSEPSLAISVFRFMGVLLTLVFMITTHSMLVSRECPHRHPRASQDFKLFESPFRAHDEAHRSVPTPGTASAPVGVPDGSGHHVIGDVFFYLTRDLNVWLHDNSHIAGACNSRSGCLACVLHCMPRRVRVPLGGWCAEWHSLWMGFLYCAVPDLAC